MRGNHFLNHAARGTVIIATAQSVRDDIQRKQAHAIVKALAAQGHHIVAPTRPSSKPFIPGGITVKGL